MCLVYFFLGSFFVGSPLDSLVGLPGRLATIVVAPDAKDCLVACDKSLKLFLLTGLFVGFSSKEAIASFFSFVFSPFLLVRYPLVIFWIFVALSFPNFNSFSIDLRVSAD